MQAILEAVSNLLPYHLLSYGALLGTELFQVRVQNSLESLPIMNSN
jgi:hypothetical protein